MISQPAICLLEHNTVESINAELESKAILKRLAEAVPVDLESLQKCRLRVSSEEPDLLPIGEDLSAHRTYMLARGTRWEFWAKNDVLEPDVCQSVVERARRYVQARISGHTKAYALDSMVEPSRAPEAVPTLRGRVLADYPTVPDKWLADTTNTYRSVWYRPWEGGDSHEIPPLEAHEPLELTNHIFRVIDGLVTWEYHVAEGDPYIDEERRDSQELDPRTANVIRQASDEVEAWMEEKGIKGQFGSVHTYWPELKRVLKEKYAIEWLSPQDLHPTRIYD